MILENIQSRLFTTALAPLIGGTKQTTELWFGATFLAPIRQRFRFTCRKSDFAMSVVAEWRNSYMNRSARPIVISNGKKRSDTSEGHAALEPKTCSRTDGCITRAGFSLGGTWLNTDHDFGHRSKGKPNSTN